jgi:serine/threonine-protein phosphatase PP1 catalytic subunit
MAGIQIDRLLAALQSAGRLPRNSQVDLPVDRLNCLCTEAIKVLRLDPIVLRIPTPIHVVGDLHGQFYDLLTYFRKCGLPPSSAYLFLGDYVDRGKNQIETLTYLLALKVKYPARVWLLRGNHETPEIAELYGFADECAKRYPGSGMFVKFVEVFKWLPMAAIIGDRIFCVHGGLSPDLTDLNMLRGSERPLDVSSDSMLSDLLWADPNTEINGYEDSERGTGYTYGEDVVRDFLRENDFDLLCRGHQCVMNGFEFPFGNSNHTVLTVFSAPNYCEEFGNKGALLKIDAALKCSFEVIDGREVAPVVRPATGVKEKRTERPAARNRSNV